MQSEVNDGGGFSAVLRVRVAEGEVEGVEENGVRCFLGVPYAAPPVGDLRFRRARPAASWEGTRRAVTDASASYQVDLSNVARVQSLVSSIDPGVTGVMPFPPAFSDDTILDHSSEDCLYLNIYAPSREYDGRLPVYVYFHGGANVTNSASGKFDYQRGEALARAEGVIVVQPQYRLGALGWVHFGLIDPTMHEAVNLGLHDQIAALRWVSENIAAFGGDPDNITIGGESAGGTAVSHMVADPSVRRYARRAIIQSLSPFNMWCTQSESEAQLIAETYRRVLVSDAISPAQPEQFLALQNVMLRLFPAESIVAWRPHGAVTPAGTDAPAIQLAEHGVDDESFEVVIGFAKDEWQFFRGHTAVYQNATREEAISVLSPVLDQVDAELLFDGYARLYPDREPAQLLSDIASFIYFKFSSLAIASSLSAQRLPVYVFQFSYDHPGLDGYLRALHTGTIPFIFRSTTPSQRRAFRSLDGAALTEVDALSAAFGALYGDFIRSGQPSETWRRFDDADQSVLWFGIPLQTRAGLLRGEGDAFAEVGITSLRELDGRMARLRGDVADRLGRIRCFSALE